MYNSKILSEDKNIRNMLALYFVVATNINHFLNFQQTLGNKSFKIKHTEQEHSLITTQK